MCGHICIDKRAYIDIHFIQYITKLRTVITTPYTSAQQTLLLATYIATRVTIDTIGHFQFTRPIVACSDPPVDDDLRTIQT